jgi:hypothetical protein
VSFVVLTTFWIARWSFGEGSARTLKILTAWFLIATYLQFFATSLALTTSGLVLQSILAIYLTIRVKLISQAV